MFKFIIRFVFDTIRTQKLRMFIVLSGTIICSFLVLNFFYRASAGVASREELLETHFFAEYQYEDCENVEKLIENLQQYDDISKICLTVWLKGPLKTAKATEIPEITEDYLYNHSEIILMSQLPLDRNDESLDNGRYFDEDEQGKILVTYFGNENKNAPSNPGESVTISGRTYEVCGLYNNLYYDFILPVDDLLDLCEEKGAQIRLEYWYDENFSYREVKTVNKELENIKESYYSKYDKPDIPMLWDVVYREGKIIFCAMIISVLNFMFVYQFFLKNRVKQYRTLKMLGVTSNKLQLIMLMEMVILYTISFALAYGILVIYIKCTNMLMYSMLKISGISYSILLVIIMIIFVVFTRKFAKRTPFASYQEI